MTDWDHADGETYEPEREGDPGSDRERLRREMTATRQFMLDGEWHRPDEIVEAVRAATGLQCDWAGVSARVRDMRKPENGGRGRDTIERRYVADGLHEYRWVDDSMPDPPLIPLATCQGCRGIKHLTDLSSKYGKPQLVGEIKGARLWEALCETCDTGKKKGMQSVWKENT